MLWCASTCSLDFTVALSAKFWPGMTWSPDLGSVGWLISACNFAQSIRSSLAHQKVDRARFLATLNESIALTKKAFKNPTNGWSWRSWVSRLISEMAALKSFVFPFWSCLFLTKKNMATKWNKCRACHAAPRCFFSDMVKSWLQIVCWRCLNRDFLGWFGSIAVMNSSKSQQVHHTAMTWICKQT